MSTEDRPAGQAAQRVAGPTLGSRPSHAPRSRLLAVVYLISLALLLTLGGGLAILASAHVSSSAITASASADHALGEALLETLGNAAMEDDPSRAARERMRGALERAVADIGLVGIALVAPDGRVRVGAGAFDLPPDIDRELRAGDPTARLVTTSDGPRLYESFPVILDGRLEVILQIVRDGAPALATAAAAQRDIALGTAAGALVLIVVLFLVFRGAQRRLDRQTQQLLESTRRDPLTGVLTHGAAVAALSDAIANVGTHPVSVAMVDIDNFRQLNDTHGHDLGDVVIRTVASVLDDGALPVRVIGRSGPDEFLVVGPGLDAQAMITWVEAARHDLASTSVKTGAGAELPLTLSIGIAVAPLHGRTSTELLSAAAMTLGEAKGGGGDQALIGRLSYAELIQEHRASFSILDGLVNAIDTRDRYTRRHSQDVARYALFLARELGLDGTVTGALHQAALLHDVGKIAVPDDVLRKPGPLTADEMEVMKQHVLLGGVLVRDLASAEQVVDGVRYHHERWDGTGYAEGLADEAIPLIARIIAVADAYSAMTTSRPYRRALSPSAALERLSRAAGSQLDPRLVDVFVLAMEASPEPPMPSDARAPSAWLAEANAA